MNRPLRIRPRTFVMTLIGVVVLSACSSTVRPIPPSTIVLRSYEPGEVQTAGVGDPIFDVQTARQHRAFRATQAFNPPRPSLLVSTPSIAEGDLFFVTSEMPQEGFFVLTSPATDYGILVDSAGVAQSWIDRNTGRRGGGGWPTAQLFEPAQRVEADETAFRAELIYSGVDGRTLKAVYREFAGNLIRPAFSQELQYDLSSNREIGYKSIRIEVLEATNAELRYRVISDGGLEWLPR